MDARTHERNSTHALRMVALTVAAARGWPPQTRLPLLALGFVCLVAGIAGGLARTGVGSGPTLASAVGLHGVLMVCGFFGTVISLERAVALERAWAYAGPLACGAGGLAILAGATSIGFWLLAIGSAVLLAASARLAARRLSLEACTLVVAAGCGFAANVQLALGVPVGLLLGWWIAFLALTIGAERLELSRYLPRPRSAHGWFAAIAVAMVVAASGSLRVTGIALLALAGWLFAYDLARKTIQARGLARYIAACLLAGYGWLAFGGTLLAMGTGYDAALHAVLVGFVFSMVFGHAPVIVPAVLRRALPYTPWFYLPLALLHASLALRAAGGLAGEQAIRMAGSIGNAAAIALFIAIAAAQAIHSRRRLQ
jgi:hypothetical protein